MLTVCCSRTPEGKIYQRAFGGQSYKYGKGGQAHRWDTKAYTWPNHHLTKPTPDLTNTH